MLLPLLFLFLGETMCLIGLFFQRRRERKKLQQVWKVIFMDKLGSHISIITIFWIYCYFHLYIFRNNWSLLSLLWKCNEVFRLDLWRPTRHDLKIRWFIIFSCYVVWIINIIQSWEKINVFHSSCVT